MATGAPGATSAEAIGIGEVTETAKAILEGAFPPLWVKGEVSNLTRHRNGHWYFTLRDRVAQLACVVWARDARRIPAAPDEGMAVVAHGQLTVYPAYGRMQFQVDAIEAEGEGLWKKAFDETKARLERDGLTDPARKRPLPRFPRTVAVVTSPDGAALRDIVAVIERRHRGVSVLVVPAAVQGDTAPASLCAALDRVRRLVEAPATPGVPRPEVLIVGRGGGSREDLWAFNHEDVARAIAASPIPTISAVGHETDVTIADLVADLRAATPSVAAESAVPVLADLEAQLATLAGTMTDGLQDRIAVGAQELSRRAGTLAQRAQLLTERRRVRCDRVAARLAQLAPRVVERRRARVETLAASLEARSPLAVLTRGFAVARGLDGATLGRRAAFTPGMPFDLLLHDGRVRAAATSVHGDAPHLRTDA